MYGSRPLIDDRDKPVTIRYFAVGVLNRARRFSKTAEDCEIFLKPLLQRDSVKHTAFWLDYADTEFVTPKIFRENDIRSIMDALREKVFAVHAADLDPDDGHTVIVAFGVDTLNKVYLATDPPVELPRAIGKGKNVLFFQIVINMKDFPVVRSDVYIITYGSWNDFTVGYFGPLNKMFRRSALKHVLSIGYAEKLESAKQPSKAA